MKISTPITTEFRNIEPREQEVLVADIFFPLKLKTQITRGLVISGKSSLRHSHNQTSLNVKGKNNG